MEPGLSSGRESLRFSLLKRWGFVPGLVGIGGQFGLKVQSDFLGLDQWGWWGALLQGLDFGWPTSGPYP